MSLARPTQSLNLNCWFHKECWPLLINICPWSFLIMNGLPDSQFHKGGSVRGGLFSLLPSTFYPVLPAPFHFAALAPFYLFSLLLFHLSLLPAPFKFFLLLLAPFPNFLLLPAPFSNFLCSLLPNYVFLGPCSLPYFRPCSLLPWVSRVILPAPWLPLTGVHLRNLAHNQSCCRLNHCHLQDQKM